ncbi:hypothetical protein RND81_04G189000 [Saponaria officinalis]|uniref:Uncharacterized protein n=1 Tax=Saponaria officinalis TaxID=3572 RepID=A0AAW1LFX0_SAPOF
MAFTPAPAPARDRYHIFARPPNHELYVGSAGGFKPKHSAASGGANPKHSAASGGVNPKQSVVDALVNNVVDKVTSGWNVWWVIGVITLGVAIYCFYRVWKKNYNSERAVEGRRSQKLRKLKRCYTGCEKRAEEVLRK